LINLSGFFYSKNHIYFFQNLQQEIDKARKEMAHSGGCIISPKYFNIVIPMQTGIHYYRGFIDSHFRGNDCKSDL
jgi:hypothetical protein